MKLEKSELLNAKTVLHTAGVGHGQAVGDLGCGAKGYFTIQAAKMVGKKGIVFAVDIMKSALASVASRARMERLENVTTVWSNLEVPGAAKIPAQRLDVALLFNTLYQSHHHENIFKEAFRLVKPGGSLAVVDWIKGVGPMGPLEKERVDVEDIRRLAKIVGLREEQMFEAGPYHFGFIFRKPE